MLHVAEKSKSGQTSSPDPIDLYLGYPEDLWDIFSADNTFCPLHSSLAVPPHHPLIHNRFTGAMGSNANSDQVRRDTSSQAAATKIVRGYVPGLLGRCLDLHLRFYSEKSGFGKTFELGMAVSLERLLRRIDDPLNEAFVAVAEGLVVGTIFVEGRSQPATDNQTTRKVARVRAFIVDSNYHGRGLGRALIEKAISFIDENDFDESQLSTFKGLDAAKTLYERAGFHVEYEGIGTTWGAEVTEQLYVRPRNRPASNPS